MPSLPVPIQRALLVGIACYLFIVVLVAIFQRKLIYLPSRAPEGMAVSQTTLKPWKAEGLTIGWTREVVHPVEIWLMFHGNAGQAADRDYVLPSLPENVSLYVLEYPGYGARAGSPSMDSINEAAAEAYDLLRKQAGGLPVSVLGESLGSGPASWLATRPVPPDRIVLMVPYDALSNVAGAQFPWLPARLLLRDRWNNVESLRSFKGRVDIFVAQEDEIIPARLGRQLAESLPGAVLHEIPGGHNDWSVGEKVRLKVERR
ncbi:MAG: alpha/beta hydrolase [Verrucomicrobiales bacterium]|nr:alpha/beta hydrolase [Verrucomicrobiales bacterium]